MKMPGGMELVMIIIKMVSNILLTLGTMAFLQGMLGELPILFFIPSVIIISVLWNEGFQMVKEEWDNRAFDNGRQ